MSLVHPFTPMKLLWHRSRIEAMQRGEPSRGPASLEWDLSNTCPHDCGFCSFGTSESQGYRQKNWQLFPYDRAVTLIPELALAGVESITFTGGGEPLMHPQAADLFLRTAQHGIAFGLVTNGYLLRHANAQIVSAYARFVRVSLDAGTEATHQLMHRPKSPQFEMILGNLGALVKQARLMGRTVPLTIGASFCVTDANYQEIGHCAARLRALGVDYLEVRPTYPTTWRGDGWDFALSNVTAATDALADARAVHQSKDFQIIGMIDRFDALASPQKGYARCQIGPLTSVLGATGDLWHCCVQRGMDGFQLANVLAQPFVDAWAEGQAKRLVESINVKKCPRCRYDGLNTVLAGVSQDAFHAAFI